MIMTGCNTIKNNNDIRQTAPLIGNLVSISETGQARVDYPGNKLGPVVAQSIITLPPDDAVPGVRVMLQFEDHMAHKPVIIGVIQAGLVHNNSTTLTAQNNPFNSALIDEKKITIDASETIELTCGKSSIVLRKDGKIVLKGIDIISRAVNTNKIKGCSVNIN